jgi:hypothetical protein
LIRRFASRKDEHRGAFSSPGSFASLKDDGRRNGESEEENERSFYSAAPSSRDRRNRSDHRNSRGSILIEFAICVPILIMCLVAMHDIPKYYQMQAKMKFAAHCCVNMIQDVSVNRANKKITISDVLRISHAWNLIIWPDLKMIHQNAAGKYPLGFYNSLILYCVVGTGDNKCKVMWSMSGQTNKKTIPTDGYIYSNASGSTLTQHVSSLFYSNSARLQREIVSTSLYPNLSIKAGERKIILEIMCYFPSPPQIQHSRALGFWMLNLKPAVNYKNVACSFFNTVVIFTPKPGLFDDTLPQ